MNTDQSSLCYCHRTKKYCITRDYRNRGRQMIARPRGTYILWEMLSLRSGTSVRIRTTMTDIKQDLITFPDHLLAALVRFRRDCSCARNTINKIKALVSYQEWLRSFCSTSIVAVVVCTLTNLVATHAGSINAFQVYRFSDQACAWKTRVPTITVEYSIASMGDLLQIGL